MNFLERLWYEQPGGMFREFEGLTTHFRPQDLALYRKLLPEPFAMPEQPVVIIYAADLLRVYWHRVITRYQEWSVLLASAWQGEIGWYPVTMPVTSWLANWGGRYLGYPKYVVDEISVARSGATCVATARNKGAVQLLLEFHPGMTRPLAAWEQQLADADGFYPGSNHLLVPPGRGPRAQRVTFQHVTPPRWEAEQGMVRVRVDPGEMWAGLVPEEGEFPGSTTHLVGGGNLVAERPA